MFGRKPYKSALMQSGDVGDVAVLPVEQNVHLKKVVAMAKDAPSHNLEAIEAALEDRKAAAASLFAIEVDAKEKINKQIADLKAKKNIAQISSKYDGKYMPVSMEVLKWRTPDGLPTFAIFSLNDPRFKISSEMEYIYAPKREKSALGSLQGTAIGVTSPYPYYAALTPSDTRQIPISYGSYGAVYPGSLPEPIKNCYADVRTNLATRSVEKSTNRQRIICRIGATFSGVIPDSTRAKIKEAQGVFKDIFILAEPKFSYEEEIVPVPIDPVVLGWDDQQLWYIDEFDITPVEEAALLIGPAT